MAKTVLITGSSRGIGRETAIYLAKNGFDIVLHCNKNIEKLFEVQKIIENMDRQTRILQFDVSNREQTKEVLLKDIEDKEYISQLNGYRQYVETITNKEIKMYLYSILDDLIEDVKKE